MRWADRARRRREIYRGQPLQALKRQKTLQQGWPDKRGKNFSSLRTIINQLLVILEGAGDVKSMSFALHQGFSRKSPCFALLYVSYCLRPPCPWQVEMDGEDILHMATMAILVVMAAATADMVLMAVATEVWAGYRGRQLSSSALAFTGPIKLTASHPPPSS